MNATSISQPIPDDGDAGDPPPFRPIAELVHEHAIAAPLHPAIVDADGASIDYGALDALMDRDDIAQAFDLLQGGDPA